MEFTEILQILFRTFLGFILLVISMKLMGKREIGELSLFDLLIILCIADIMIIGVEHYNESILFFIIPLVLLVTLQKIISFIDLRYPKIRTLLEGKEEFIIFKGKILINNMIKEKYNMSDLYTQLRSKDIRSIDEVEYAILETNGNLSVFKYCDQSNAFPLPVIVSGIIDEKVLSYTNYTKDWLLKEIKKKGIKSVKDVYGATIINNQLIVVKKKS